MADFMAVFVGVGRLCSVRFLEWFGHLLPLEEGSVPLTLQGLPWGLSFWTQ